jgi:hypothetical protein
MAKNLSGFRLLRCPFYGHVRVAPIRVVEHDSAKQKSSYYVAAGGASRASASR